MSDVQLALVPVDALPVKERAAGPVGRPSPYTPVLEQIRAAGPGQAYRITAAPLELKPNKAGQIAARIRNGGVAGSQGGEFKATDQDGHVFVEFVGSLGIAAYQADEPVRQARAAARAATKASKTNAEPVADEVAAEGAAAYGAANGVVTPEFATAGASTSVDGW